MTTEAQRRATRKYRAKVGALFGDRTGERTGTVPVTCWCEAGFVRIPLAAVGTTTGRCERPECREPQAA